ncbi:hypothetical protein CK203_023333 [Vitis vinifera]|uniref:Uncharacterized protein n=1 Tax=Vitis vinifera TaxID=29760 RepID=A0A438J6T9_VITVI|nr:hypothetical protein CK203_023333 [Vitis vinifera]
MEDRVLWIETKCGKFSINGCCQLLLRQHPWVGMGPLWEKGEGKFGEQTLYVVSSSRSFATIPWKAFLKGTLLSFHLELVSHPISSKSLLYALALAVIIPTVILFSRFLLFPRFRGIKIILEPPSCSIFKAETSWEIGPINTPSTFLDIHRIEFLPRLLHLRKLPFQNVEGDLVPTTIPSGLRLSILHILSCRELNKGFPNLWLNRGLDVELFEISDIINGRNELAIKARKNFNREMAMEVKKKKEFARKISGFDTTKAESWN